MYFTLGDLGVWYADHDIASMVEHVSQDAIISVDDKNIVEEIKGYALIHGKKVNVFVVPKLHQVLDRWDKTGSVSQTITNSNLYPVNRNNYGKSKHSYFLSPIKVR